MREAARDRLEGGSEVLRRVGSACWSLVGIVVVVAIIVSALAVISEVVLPLVLAAVLAVIFAPSARWLRGRGAPSPLAAAVVVAGLVAATAGSVLLATSAVTTLGGEWSFRLDDAMEELEHTTDAAGLDSAQLDGLRHALSSARGFVMQGLATIVISGVGTVIGFLAGTVLAVLLLYYLLKDGDELRSRVLTWFPLDARVDVDALISRSSSTIRAYAAARTLLSAVVAVIITGWSALLGVPMLGTIAVVNFFGGYVPYIGAVLGGAVAVILTLSEHGLAGAITTLVVVLVANFALENLLEPRVMGRRLDIHPMLVLIFTAIGGILGGIVGLMLAVPLAVVTADVLGTFRRGLDRAR